MTEDSTEIPPPPFLTFRLFYWSVLAAATYAGARLSYLAFGSSTVTAAPDHQLSIEMYVNVVPLTIGLVLLVAVWLSVGGWIIFTGTTFSFVLLWTFLVFSGGAFVYLVSGDDYAAWNVILGKSALGIVFFNLAALQVVLVVILRSIFYVNPNNFRFRKFQTTDERMRDFIARQDPERLQDLNWVLLMSCPRLAMAVAFTEPLAARVFVPDLKGDNFVGLLVSSLSILVLLAPVYRYAARTVITGSAGALGAPIRAAIRPIFRLGDAGQIGIEALRVRLAEDTWVGQRERED